MKTVVIYNSQTGFTRRYAQWIAEAAGGVCLELSEAKRRDLSDCGAIVFGGWARAEESPGLAGLRPAWDSGTARS